MAAGLSVFDAGSGGVHGSRIGARTPKAGNLEQLARWDYLANYSALFAVKLPGGANGMDNRALPLTFLMEELAGAVSQLVAGSRPDGGLVGQLPDDAKRVAPYVFLPWGYPLQQVDVDIFDK